MSRESDERLCSLADRLRLPYLRDHMTEVLENIAQAKMTPRQAIEYAFGKEVQQRECNRFKQLLQSAHLPTIKKLEDFDLTAQPSINPGTIRELASLEWIDAGENVAFFGVPGVGKTHLAIGLGYKAIESGRSVRFYTAANLLTTLEKASREDTLEAKLREINKPQVIIIDEIGYLPFSPSAAHLLFQLINRRYEKKSVVITSNRPPSEWRLIFADEAVAMTILDHLLHHSTALTITGSSYRLREHRRQALNKGLLTKDNRPES